MKLLIFSFKRHYTFKMAKLANIRKFYNRTHVLSIYSIQEVRYQIVKVNVANFRKKIAACLLGGLLFCSAACAAQPATVERSQPAVQLEPSPVPVVVSADTPTATAVAAAVSAPTTPPVTPTPTLEPLPIPAPEGGPYAYHTISQGQTLGYIALLYQTEIEELVQMNNLSGPSALLQIGQVLRVPIQTDIYAPANTLLPDSEVVYSPAYLDFDLAGFIEAQGGYLAGYREFVNGEERTGTQIVARVAEQFSVGPRLLLAVRARWSPAGNWNCPAHLSEPVTRRARRGAITARRCANAAPHGG